MQKKKTKIITARMTPADKKVIHQRAKATGMTVTDYLTACALGKEIIRVEEKRGVGPFVCRCVWGGLHHCLQRKNRQRR